MKTLSNAKFCVKCNQLRPHEAFYFHAGSSDGRRAACKTCYNRTQNRKLGDIKRQANALTLADFENSNINVAAALRRMPLTQQHVYERLVATRMQAAVRLQVAMKPAEIVELKRDCLLFVLTFGSNAKAEADALDEPIPAQPAASYSSLRAYDYGLPLWLDVE